MGWLFGNCPLRMVCGSGFVWVAVPQHDFTLVGQKRFGVARQDELMVGLAMPVPPLVPPALVDLARTGAFAGEQHHRHERAHGDQAIDEPIAGEHQSECVGNLL